MKQSKYHIALPCQTYIVKILDNHGWQNLSPMHNILILIWYDTNYPTDIDLTKGPDEVNLQTELEQQM